MNELVELPLRVKFPSGPAAGTSEQQAVIIQVFFNENP